MRRIVYVLLSENIEAVYDKCLELCAACTPLVEPVSQRSVFLDLTGCGSTGKIIRSISQGVYNEAKRAGLVIEGPDPGNVQPKNLDAAGRCIEIGLASSRLLARSAVEVTHPPICPQTSWRLTTWAGVRVITVVPGQESNFIAVLPLNNFFPLQKDIVKKLTRLGLSQVGELSALPEHQLSLLSHRDGALLAQLARGEDSSPVTGLYPPFRITYPINLDASHNDFISLGNIIREASHRLAAALEARHYACSNIRLEISHGLHKLFLERQLSTPCSRPEHLLNILLGLIRQAQPLPAMTGLLITLYDLAPRQMLQPDIFSFRVNCEKERRGARLEDLISNLTDRFPGSLKSGLQPDHREQVLAHWDPWRMTGVNSISHR